MATKTINRYGNTCIKTNVLTPYNDYSGVGYFDGAGDYLAIPSCDDFDFVMLMLLLIFGLKFLLDYLPIRLLSFLDSCWDIVLLLLV